MIFSFQRLSDLWISFLKVFIYLILLQSSFIISKLVGHKKMSIEQDILQLYDEVADFFKKNINNKKCILIVGPCGSGKTSLINYLNGASYIRQDSQDGLPFLTLNADSETQPIVFKHQKVPFQLTAITSTDPNDGQQVVVLQMPSFVNLKEQQSNQISGEDLDLKKFQKLVFCYFVWQTVVNLANKIHISLINPYQFVTDDHKLVQFYQIWEKSITQQEEVKERFKACVSIIFTKAEYEDDKQSLLTSFEHVTQAGNEYITDNNTFSNATQEERVHCFLSQDTIQGQGAQLLNSILSSATYYQKSEKYFFNKNWLSTFMWGIMKLENPESLKLVFQNIYKIQTKFLSSNEYICKTSGSIPILGYGVLLNFINTLPKNNSLHKNLGNMSNDLNEILKKEQFITTQIIDSIIKYNKRQTSSYISLLDNLTKILLEKLAPEQQNFTFLFQKLTSTFWQFYEIEQDHKNQFFRWFDQLNILWKFSSIFQLICQEHKQQIQEFSNYIQIYFQQLNKKIVKNYQTYIRGLISNGLRSFDVLNSIKDNKEFLQSDQFKSIFSVYAVDNDDQIEQEQQESGNTDIRIKRYYYPTQQMPDLFISIKDRAKKIIMKQVKADETSQKQEVKNLLVQVERKMEGRALNLGLLADKLKSFRMIHQALQVLLQLGDPIRIFQFLNQDYFNFVSARGQRKHYEYIQNQLLSYLEENCTLYRDHERAKRFLPSLHACYDFIAEKSQNAQQYSSYIAMSNQIGLPTVEQQLGQNTNDSTLDTSQIIQQYGRYASFTKPQIIDLVTKRQDVIKRNSTIHIQIKKYLEALNRSAK